MDYNGRPIKRSRGNDFVLPDDLAVTSLTTTGEIKSDLEVLAPSLSVVGSEVPQLSAVVPDWDATQANYASVDTSFPASNRVYFGRNVNAKRAVQTVQYVRPGAMEVNGLVNISLSLVSDGGAPGNNFFFGVHLDRPCVGQSRAFVGNEVGEKGYFFHSQSEPGTSYISQDGVRTPSSHPGSLSFGIHLVTIVRNSLTQWSISFFLPGGTPIGEFITTQFNELSRLYFIVGDNSPTSSGFFVDGIELQTTFDYGSNSPLNYTVSQSDNGSLLVGPDIIRADGNEVCVKPVLSCMHGIVTPLVETGAIFCTSETFERPPPSVDTMLAAEWDFVGTEGVLQIPGGIRFVSGNFPRAITSKAYFVPNDLEIGGYLQMVVRTANGTNYRQLVGVSFKNEATVYEGNGVGAAPSEFYISPIEGTTFPNRYIVGGIIQPDFQEPNFSGLAATIGVKVTRTSGTSWTITYSGNGVETGPPTVFGTEFASRFCYWYCGKSLTSVTLSAHDIVETTITYDGWNPRQVKYTLAQDASNTLVCADTTGNVVYKCSPNEYTITKPLLCDYSISANKRLFGYSCPVQATFFASIGLFQVTGTVQTDLQRAETVYGSEAIPTMNPGSIYSGKLRGWLRTDSSNSPILEIQIYLGPQMLITSPVELRRTGTFRSYWELDFTVMGLQNLSNTNPGNATVKATGIFKYQRNLLLEGDKNTMEGTGLFTMGEPVVPLQNPGNLTVKARWIDDGDILTLQHSEYTYSGYNV